jgi:hypothetical protein
MERMAMARMMRQILEGELQSSRGTPGGRSPDILAGRAMRNLADGLLLRLSR